MRSAFVCGLVLALVGCAGEDDQDVLLDVAAQEPLPVEGDRLVRNADVPTLEGAAYRDVKSARMVLRAGEPSLADVTSREAR